MPSSLPPSSPPSASSEPKVDHVFTHQPSSLPRLSTDDVFSPSDDEREGGQDVVDLDEDTYHDSDPFGFFALEQKLKARRVLASNQEVRTTRRNGSHPAPPTAIKRLDEHNVIGTEKLSEGVLSPRIRTSSLPSTPSPSKPSGRRIRAKHNLHKDDLKESELVTHKTSSGRFEAKAADTDKSHSTPKPAKTLNWKRPVRRAAASERKRHKAPDSHGDAGQDAPPSSKLKGMPKRDAKARGTAGRRPREKVNTQGTDSEEYRVSSQLVLVVLTSTDDIVYFHSEK